MLPATQVIRITPRKHVPPDLRRLGGLLARMNMEPGWRWSECVKPVVKTESCQVAHVGYVVSGSITIKLNDGTFTEGMSYTVPPGHDAWVEGKQPFRCIEVLSAEQYAKPA